MNWYMHETDSSFASNSGKRLPLSRESAELFWVSHASLRFEIKHNLVSRTTLPDLVGWVDIAV